MKRRDFTTKVACGLIFTEFTGCSYLGFTTGKSKTKQEKNPPLKIPEETSTRRTSRGRTTPGITDLKTLSKLLEQAGRPLTNVQVEYLLTLKPGPEFTEKMTDILTDAQKEALKNATGGSRRRRR